MIASPAKDFLERFLRTIETGKYVTISYYRPNLYTAEDFFYFLEQRQSNIKLIDNFYFETNGTEGIRLGNPCDPEFVHLPYDYTNFMGNWISGQIAFFEFDGGLWTMVQGQFMFLHIEKDKKELIHYIIDLDWD